MTEERAMDGQTGDALWWRAGEAEPWHALRDAPIRSVMPWIVSGECGEFRDDADVEIASSAVLDLAPQRTTLCGTCLHAMGIL